MLEAPPIYHPRDPFQSPLWNILHNNYEEFKANYDESYEKQYGFFRPVIDDVVYGYLKCEDLKEGFARVRCMNPDCRHEHLLAFSCKGRWFCPSCHSKKVIKFGEDICNNILHPVPPEQFIARVMQYIPEKGFQMVRYYGLCKALHKPYYAEFSIMPSYVLTLV